VGTLLFGKITPLEFTQSAHCVYLSEDTLQNSEDDHDERLNLHPIKANIRAA